jgi:hypothetical protein
VGRTGLTDGCQSDRCVTTPSRDFEVEDTYRDRKTCVEAKRSAFAGHLSDGATTKIPKVPMGGVYLSLM